MFHKTINMSFHLSTGKHKTRLFIHYQKFCREMNEYDLTNPEVPPVSWNCPENVPHN
jgi:hypothetical protein